MTLHTTIKAAAAAAALSFAATAASAESLTFNGSTSTASSGTSTGSFVTVNITASPQGGGNTLAGGFDMNGSPTLGNFVAWCFDLSKNLKTDGVANYVFEDFLDTNALGRVQKVFDRNYDDGFTPLNQTASAAFQLAVWEAIYDDDWNLATGGFKAVAATTATGGQNIGLSADVISLAQTYLTDASTYSGNQNWIITQLKSSNASTGAHEHQHLGTVSVIPIPAGALLILSALGLAAGVRRYGRTT